MLTPPISSASGRTYSLSSARITSERAEVPQLVLKHGEMQPAAQLIPKHVSAAKRR